MNVTRDRDRTGDSSSDRATRRGHGVRRWLAMLAVLPFLLLSFLGTGTMLTHDLDQGVRVVLCINGGPVEMLMAADGRIASPPDAADGGAFPGDHGGTDPCQWAPHGQPLVLAGNPGLPPPLRLARGPEPFAAPPEHLRRTEVLAPLARGPPTLHL